MLHAPRRSRVVAMSALAGTMAVAGLAYTGASLAASGPSDLSGNGAARRNTTTDRSAEVAAAINPAKAKNVILLIGDGMGDSEITSARNYAKGAAGRFDGIDALPLTGQYTTYSLQKGTTKPDYVPDSAATGSAWATGTKTYDNAVSVDTFGKPQKTLLELAKENGLKTGDVTTSEIQDATPAVQVSHISARSCYGPTQVATTCANEALEKGGLGSITEQLLATRPDVTMGGGLTTFAQKATGGSYVGKTLEQQAIERGYQVVGKAPTTAAPADTATTVPGTKAQLDAITTADQTKPLLALFAAGNMPVRYTGPAAVVDGDKQAPSTCAANANRPASQPTLADMTTKAISLLDNPKGFFLQVEGASIDKQDHSADACGQIGEVVDLDEAVQVALDYAKKQGNTSVFVTADHAHTSQIIEVGSTSPGLSVALTTVDGQPMAINYGTSPLGGSQQHTGSQLRIAGYGPQAANIVGLTDQTDLFFTIKNALFGTGSTLPNPNPTTPTTPAPAPSSNGASLSVKPGTVRVGQSAVAVGLGFLADTKVTVSVRGGGKTVTKTKSLSAGGAAVSVKGKKVGTYTVTFTGTTSGKSVSDKLKVRRR